MSWLFNHLAGSTMLQICVCMCVSMCLFWVSSVRNTQPNMQQDWICSKYAVDVS